MNWLVTFEEKCVCLSKLKKARHGLSGYFPLLCFGVVQYGFAFVYCAFGAISKILLPGSELHNFFLPVFSSRKPFISNHTFRPLVHLKLCFIYGIWVQKVILLLVHI